MIRTVRVLPLLLAPLLLTACGEERKDAGEAGAPAPASVSASASASAPASELVPRARALGIAPELVYVTGAPGFTLARQSVGVYGADGFSATYVSRESGGQLRLYVDRGTMSAADCTGQQPVCEEDGDGVWYRGGGGRHEYVVVKEGHVVRLEGDASVPRDVVRKAAEDAHRPSGEEAAELLPPAPAGDAEPPAPADGSEPTGPVERGDLPPAGDGAPRNDVGVGG